MADNMIIDLQLTGANSVINQLRSVATTVNALRQANAQAAQQLRKQSSLQRNTATSMKIGTANLTVSRAVINPVAATMQINGATVINVRGNIGPARNVTPRTPPNFNKRLMNLIYSTRFGPSAGGGLAAFPLVGRSMALLGAKAQPLVFAFAALSLAATQTHQALTQMRNEMIIGGGGVRETAFGQSLASAAGVQSIGAAAREVMGNISQGGAASGLAASYGVTDYGLYDSTNKTKKFLQLMDRAVLSETLTEQEAMRNARAFGASAEQFLALRHLNPETRQSLMRDAGARESVINGFGGSQALMEFNIQWQRMLTNFQTDLIPAGTFLLKELAVGFKYLANMFAWLDPYAKTHAAQYEAEKKKMEWERKHADALNRHTDALNQNTAAMTTNGSYGGGARASAAIPKGWQGNNYDVWRGQAAALGAFQI